MSKMLYCHNEVNSHSIKIMHNSRQLIAFMMGFQSKQVFDSGEVRGDVTLKITTEVTMIIRVFTKCHRKEVQGLSLKKRLTLKWLRLLRTWLERTPCLALQVGYILLQVSPQDCVKEHIFTRRVPHTCASHIPHTSLKL